MVHRDLSPASQDRQGRPNDCGWDRPASPRAGPGRRSVADLTSTDPRSRRQVAYITSHFPSVTQTFVFREVLELKRRGWDVQLHAFVRSGLPPDVHPEATALAQQCVYPSVRSVTAAQLWWLRRHPRAYGAAWAFALRGNWPRLGRLLHAVAVVPIAALFARDIS